MHALLAGCTHSSAAATEVTVTALTNSMQVAAACCHVRTMSCMSCFGWCGCALCGLGPGGGLGRCSASVTIFKAKGLGGILAQAVEVGPCVCSTDGALPAATAV